MKYVDNRHKLRRIVKKYKFRKSSGNDYDLSYRELSSFVQIVVVGEWMKADVLNFRKQCTAMFCSSPYT